MLTYLVVITDRVNSVDQAVPQQALEEEVEAEELTCSGK